MSIAWDRLRIIEDFVHRWMHECPTHTPTVKRLCELNALLGAGIKTECCGVSSAERYCLKCGWECRLTDSTITAAHQEAR